MKICNLYIGEIREITNIEKVEFDNKTFESKILGKNVDVIPNNTSKKIDFGSYIYKSKLVHKTILLKTFSNSKTVRDLIYGGRYKIGNYKAEQVGSMYATNLNQYYILRALRESGYTKKHISILKLAKVMKKR